MPLSASHGLSPDRMFSAQSKSSLPTPKMTNCPTLCPNLTFPFYTLYTQTAMPFKLLDKFKRNGNEAAPAASSAPPCAVKAVYCQNLALWGQLL